MRNSRLIISKGIKLDKNYTNVYWGDTPLLNILRSASHFISEDTNFSFLKTEENVIITHTLYSQALESNYIAFQNTDYANKWFFAFVDRVEYLSENATKIYYTIDVNSTFFGDVTVEHCFVEREHVLFDNIGDNTLPENLDTGEYVCSEVVPLYEEGNDFYQVIATSYVPETINVNYGNLTYGGIFSGCAYLVMQDALSVGNFIRGMNSLAKADAIVAVFMAPASLVGSLNFEDGYIVNPQKPEQHIQFKYALVEKTETHSVLTEDMEVNLPANIDGYTPKNNKLYTYPYNYFFVTNNVGSDVEYHYEDFINNHPLFSTYGVITPGCSIKTFPVNYKKLQDGNFSSYSYCYGLTGAKYPLCSWQSDAYTNWLTQNGVNIALSTASSAVSILAGAGMAASGAGAIAGAGMIGAGIAGITGTMASNYQHSLIPPQSKGATSSGDVTFSSGHMDIPAYKMSVRAEYAQTIDDYFTRFGYKINRTKIPEYNTRPYWNYLKIGTGEVIGHGNFPNDYMEEINNIYRKGTTIWHNMEEIGNYELDNKAL